MLRVVSVAPSVGSGARMWIACFDLEGETMEEGGVGDELTCINLINKKERTCVC